METHILTESKPYWIRLSAEQIVHLKGIGQRLASDKTWWGASEQQSEKSVIKIRPANDEGWLVTVVDAIGSISIPGLHLEVNPKISLEHVLYLFGQSGHFPRIDSSPNALGASRSLWEMVSKWFIEEIQKVLRKDLLHDYFTDEAWLPYVRGSLDVRKTNFAIGSGRLEAFSRFDDFNIDTPLNRILKAALRTVSSSAALPVNTRTDATRLLSRFGDVGVVHPADYRVQVDRRSAYYKPSIELGRHVIAGYGRSLSMGSNRGWSFLIRTPEMVEAGIRNVLAKALASEWIIEKFGRTSGDGSITFNPDLVFEDGLAVGDIKYKLIQDTWNRSDLNQSLAFAVAFYTTLACIVAFSDTEIEPRTVSVGDRLVSQFSWPAYEGITPLESAIKVSSELGSWLVDAESYAKSTAVYRRYSR